MVMKRRTVTTAILAALVLAALSITTTARANTVDVVLDGFGANSTTTFWAASHDGDDVVAGVYELNKTAGTGVGNTWSNGEIPAFCIELQEPAPHTTRTYQVTMPEDVFNSTTGQSLGTTKANYLRELWARYYDSSWAGSGLHTSQQHADAEAFAAAVWEIVYENLPANPAGWNVNLDSTTGPGGFRAEYLDADKANTWLHSLTGIGPKADLRAFVNQGGQDYLVAVPEPATVILLGIGGLLSLAGRRRHCSQASHKNR
jgi:hypothetical protein